MLGVRGCESGRVILCSLCLGAHVYVTVWACVRACVYRLSLSVML